MELKGITYVADWIEGIEVIAGMIANGDMGGTVTEAAQGSAEAYVEREDARYVVGGAQHGQASVRIATRIGWQGRDDRAGRIAMEAAREAFDLMTDWGRLSGHLWETREDGQPRTFGFWFDGGAIHFDFGSLQPGWKAYYARGEEVEVWDVVKGECVPTWAVKDR